MNTLRLKWEPENLTPLSEIENYIFNLTHGDGNTFIMGNGALFFFGKKENETDVETTQNALNHARSLVNFEIRPLLGRRGTIVFFHKVVAVFIGGKEWETRREEVQKRQEELLFPGERFFVPPGEPPENILIGLYARGKLQRDAYHFNFYKRV